MKGSTIGVIKGDTRSLDYTSYGKIHHNVEPRDSGDIWRFGYLVLDTTD